jgi:hypothetical protein
MFSTRVEHLVESSSVTEAAEYFDVPRSVIAAVLETEFELDAQSSAERFLEATAMRLACSNFATGGTSACGERSVGVGQIQVRRADYVDDDVKAFFAESADGDFSRFKIEAFWGGDPAEVFERLQQEHTNSVYVTAYMAALRDEHPSGTDWGTIYSERTQIGEYNTDPDFRAQFESSGSYYGYLDF